MELASFDKNAKVVLAAGLDWWNSTTLEALGSVQPSDRELVAKLEHDLELGRELFLELTGYDWTPDCPYLEYLQERRTGGN